MSETKEPFRIIIGDGHVKINTGKIEDLRCLSMVRFEKAQPVGTIVDEPAKETPQEDLDAIIAFRNIEGARFLQDMLNELVCEWSRDLAPTISPADAGECAS